MPSKVYQHDETPITWLASGGTEAFTPTSLGAGAGWQGAYHDFGTSARARLFAWRAWIKPGATRVVGEFIPIFFTTSDGTHYDNDDGTGDVAVSALDKLRNLAQIGSIQIDEDAAVEMVASGVIEVAARYGAPVVYNATANALSATAGDFGFMLTSIPDEIQAGSAAGYMDNPEAIDDDLNDNFRKDASLDTTGSRFTGAEAWAWVNQGGATATIVRGRLELKAPSSASASKRIIKQTLPSGNWRYRCNVAIRGNMGTTMDTGLTLRESATGKLITFQIGYSLGFLIWVSKWTDATTFAASYANQTMTSQFLLPAWLEIEYDGTNYYWRYAMQDNLYYELQSAAKADFFTTAADEIGLHAYNDNSNDCYGYFREFYRVG